MRSLIIGAFYICCRLGCDTADIQKYTAISGGDILRTDVVLSHTSSRHVHNRATLLTSVPPAPPLCPALLGCEVQAHHLRSRLHERKVEAHAIGRSHSFSTGCRKHNKIVPHSDIYRVSDLAMTRH